jgi:nucleoside-diphosphate-sugar epimerase
LRDALLQTGLDVVSLRRSGSPEATRGRSVVVDYANVQRLERLVAEERPAYVFHVAGTTKGVSYADFHAANVLPTQNLVSALCSKFPEVRRFVYVSSLTSYGPSTRATPLTEHAPRSPVEFYGKSKLEAERIVEGVGSSIPWTILRPAGVYGPGDVDYFQLFRSVENGMNVFFGNRDRLFSAVWVDDVVAAILGVLERQATLHKGYFVCDGVPVSWGTFQEHIIRASGRKVRTLELPEFLAKIAAVGGELMTKIDKQPRLLNRQKCIMLAQDAWTCRHDALAADSGYAPKVQVAEGTALAYEWYRAQRWL